MGSGHRRGHIIVAVGLEFSEAPGGQHRSLGHGSGAVRVGGRSHFRNAHRQGITSDPFRGADGSARKSAAALGIEGVRLANANDKYYAFLKTAADGSERVLVVLNFQDSPQTIEVDLGLVEPTGLVELRTGQLTERSSPIEPFKVELQAYGYRFYQVLSAP